MEEHRKINKSLLAALLGLAIVVFAGGIIVGWQFFLPGQRDQKRDGTPQYPFLVAELCRDFRQELDGKKVYVSGRIKEIRKDDVLTETYALPRWVTIWDSTDPLYEVKTIVNFSKNGSIPLVGDTMVLSGCAQRPMQIDDGPKTIVSMVLSMENPTWLK